VGEIAIWARPPGFKLKGAVGVSIPFGAEVPITGAWAEREIRTKNGILIAMCHTIDFQGRDFAALKGWLRKKPPKQDWQRLCNLTDLPREVAHV
jgi:hypothetical protein